MLRIGSQTFYPDDFRDGVIPEQMYILVVGAGGGGGGTGATVYSASGGGAGGFVGAVVDLKASYDLKLTVGTGGAGGTSSSNSGTAGGYSQVTVTTIMPETGADCETSAYMKANGGDGGKAKNGTGGAGGTTSYLTYASGSLPLPGGGLTAISRTLLRCVTAAAGGAGSSGKAGVSAGTSTGTLFTNTTYTTVSVSESRSY